METAAGRQACDGLPARLGLTPLARRPLATLSGGGRQRLVLARALARESPVPVL